MKDYERLTEKGKPKYCEKLKSGIANWEAILRLSNLEDKIESGEIDYVSDKDKEIARLTAENERLQTENAKIDEYRCVIDDISEQCRELEAENEKLRRTTNNV